MWFHLVLGFLDQSGSFKWWQKLGPCCCCRCLWTGMLQKLQRAQLWTHSSLKLEEGTAPKTFPSEKKCSRCTPHWQCLRFKIHTEVVLRVGFISYTLPSYRLLVTLRISFDFNLNCPPPSSSTYTSGHKDSLLAGRPSAAPPPLMALTVCWSQTHGSRRSAWDKEFHYECSVSFGCQLLLQGLLAY